MRVAYLSSVLLIVGCSAGADSSEAGGGGGGVSFGGAQDIGELRGILEAGGIPGASTLDANGFFNEHYNAPPPASCGHALCLTPGMAAGHDWLGGQKQATLQISITTPVDPTTYTRKPLSLVVVVDHSGSMAEDQRLEKVKVGLTTLIDNLRDEDRLAIVAFDDTVTLGAPFGAELDRPALHAVVDALRPDGGTNIYSGLERGFAQLPDMPDLERQSRVILLSDGVATAGNTSRDAIITMATSHVEQGIGLTTIGVGQTFDVELMRGLAERGAGNFYFLEDATAATEVFTQELDYFVTPLALDVSITASAGTGFDLGEVVGTRMWNPSTRGGDMQIPAVFLASRTSQTGEPGRRGGGSMIFIQLLPNSFGDGKVADFTLRYRVPGTDELVTQELALVYGGDSTETLENPYLSHPEMAERYAMYNMFLGLRLATQSSGLACARAALLAVRERAVAWNARREIADPDLVADIALVDLYLANIERVEPAAGTAAPALETCGDPYGDGAGYGDSYEPTVGCASVAAPSGLLTLSLVGLAGLVAVRRRRRR